MSLFLILGGIIFIYLLISKPGILALLFIIITIAGINAELASLPLNSRALMGIALFFRILVDKRDEKIPSFTSNFIALIIFFFIIYSFFITLFNDLFSIEVLKQSGLACVSAYIGYYYYFKFKQTNFDFLQFCLIGAALICFADLVYTYAYFGSFPVQRVYFLALHLPPVEDELDPGGVNHNYLGQICGMCFVYSLNNYINGRLSKKLALGLFPIAFLGVLMSTSRSALLALFVITFVLIAKELRHKEKAKKVYSLIFFAIGGIFLALFLFITLQSYLAIKSQFIEEITSRLITEPIAVVNKHLGLNYNAEDLGAMDWREEASANAYEAFLKFNFNEQLFGIGYAGFIYRNLGNGLNPHNGILLILIENGIIGFSIYFFIIFYLVRKSLKSKTVSSLSIILLFFIFYCIGQNGELTSGVAFLFIGSLIAENKYNSLSQLNSEQLGRVFKVYS